MLRYHYLSYQYYLNLLLYIFYVFSFRLTNIQQSLEFSVNLTNVKRDFLLTQYHSMPLRKFGNTNYSSTYAFSIKSKIKIEICVRMEAFKI